MNNEGVTREATLERVAYIISKLTRQPILAIPVFLAVALNVAMPHALAWTIACLLVTTVLPLFYLLILHRFGKIADPSSIARVERTGPLWVVTSLWIIAFVVLVTFGLPVALRSVFLAYLLVTPTFALLTLHINPSLHSAGAAWATVCCTNIFGGWSLLVAVLLPIVWWARMTLGRHTAVDLFLGTVIGASLSQLAFTLSY